MKNTVLIEREYIWPKITAAVKECRRKCHVAVAYMGSRGATMLPLPAGSKLVVDASNNAVSGGQTNPTELLKLFRDGVEIYSVSGLHAKVYTVGTRLYIGSANVSANSKERLHEAVFTTADRTLVRQARDYVLSLCTAANELGEEKLRMLESEYRPPKFEAGRKAQRGTSGGDAAQRLYVAHLHLTDFDPRHVREYEEGSNIAHSLAMNDTRYIVYEIEWSGLPAVKDEDFIVMVCYEHGKTYVSPPARVLNVELWEDRKGAYVYCEVLNRKRKTLEFVNSKLGSDILSSQRFRKFSYTNEIGKLWK
jgi:hypothetical protein